MRWPPIVTAASITIECMAVGLVEGWWPGDALVERVAANYPHDPTDPAAIAYVANHPPRQPHVGDVWVFPRGSHAPEVMRWNGRKWATLLLWVGRYVR